MCFCTIQIVQPLLHRGLGRRLHRIVHRLRYPTVGESLQWRGALRTTSWVRELAVRADVGGVLRAVPLMPGAGCLRCGARLNSPCGRALQTRITYTENLVKEGSGLHISNRTQNLMHSHTSVGKKIKIISHTPEHAKPEDRTSAFFKI